MAKTWIIVGGLLGAVAVAIGAYHAHGLEGLIEKRYARGEDDPEYIEKSDQLYSKTADKDENGRMSGKEIVAWQHELMDYCDTAVKYQFYHALAILGIGVLLTRCHRGARILNIAAITMLLGVLGFSGGLYCTVFAIAKLPPLIVPLGGLLMIAGWLTLAVAGCFMRADEAVLPPSKSA